MNKVCWVDLRAAGPARDAVRQEALHHRVDGVVAADPTDLDGLPPTVTRVLMPDGDLPAGPGTADVVHHPVPQLAEVTA